VEWASQGVLLLNATLTVVKSQANSHVDIGWGTFTSAIISHISKTCSDVVFMLWGNFAQKKGASIDTTKHLVLKSVHPRSSLSLSLSLYIILLFSFSPLSAHRGFMGCRHFSKANEYLESKGKKAIDWKITN
jgi:uracil-DNA glycosylase